MGAVNLGQLFPDPAVADLQTLDFAEPTFPSGFDNAALKVLADLLHPRPLGGVWPQE